MRRFLAYIVMLVTMLFAIAFNTQTVLENKIDAMEFGTSTELVYSLTNREESEYDKATHPEIQEQIVELKSADIEKNVMDRLDTAGVRNAQVSIVKGDDEQNGYQLHISLSPLNDTELSNVKEIIGYQGWLSISTEEDTFQYYETNNEFFVNRDDEDVATLLYSGTNPYPVLNVKSADFYDTLKTQAEEASDNNASSAHRFYAEGDSSEEEEKTTKVYLWMNRTIDDTYDKAYGTHETVVQEDVKRKVIAEIDMDNWNSDDLQLGFTTDTNGEAFTISSARAFVNMLNCDDYGYDIAFLYQNALTAQFGSSSITLVYVIFGIALLAIAAFMIAFYGLAGLTGGVTMLGSVLVSFLLFSILGFEFSVAALCGLAAVVALSILISVNYFERVKAELKAGHDIVKANQLGYKKSFLTTLDVSLVSLVASVFSFLICTGSMKTFFGVIMIGTIFAFIITNYINKWMMYWLVKDTQNDNLPFFYFKKVNDKVNTKSAKKVSFASAEKKHFTHKSMIGLAVVAILTCGIGLTVSFLTSHNTSFFQTYGNFSSGYVLNIEFSDNGQSYEPLETSQNYLNYIIAIGKFGNKENNIGNFNAYLSKDESKATSSDSFVLLDDTATVNVVEKKDEDGFTYYVNYFSVEVNKDLNNVFTNRVDDCITTIKKVMGNYDVENVEGSTSVFTPVAGNSHYIDDSLVIGSYQLKPTNIVHSSEYVILVIFMISLFTVYYFLVRYGFLAALTSTATGSLASALYLGLLACLRIPYSSFTCFGALFAVVLINLFMVPILSRIRETLKERGLKKNATSEQLAEISSDSFNKSISMILPVSAISVIFFIAIAFVNVNLIGLAISGVLFVLLDFVIVALFMVPFYHFVATHVSFSRLSKFIADRKAARKAKKGIKEEEIRKVSPDGVIYVDDGPHETIIPGLNDFIKNN